LKSTLTKSKNLDLHLYLIEYDDPEDIPFNAIAEATGTEPNKIRALMRSVKDEKTYLGLLEIGVSSEDIPYWYRRPEFIRKITKAKVKIVEEEKVQRPTKISGVFNPLERLNLPPIFKPTQREDAETYEYHVEDYDNERYMSPAEAQVWMLFLKNLQEDNLREREYQEELARLRERAKRLPTPEEVKAWWRARQLFEAIEISVQIKEFIFWNQIINHINVRERKDFLEAMADFQNTLKKVINAIYEVRKPTRVPVKLTPLIPPNNDDIFQQLIEVKKVKDDERLAGFRALAELGKDIQERDLLAKRARHWRFYATSDYIMKRAFRTLNPL
jgi:hypothetical protein